MNALQLFTALRDAYNDTSYRYTLVTPISERGSLPCPAGARMLVKCRDDVSIPYGTVGGGKTELSSVLACKNITRPTVLYFSHANPVESSAPVCGGQVALLFEPLECMDVGNINQVLNCLHDNVHVVERIDITLAPVTTVSKSWLCMHDDDVTDVIGPAVTPEPAVLESYRQARLRTLCMTDSGLQQCDIVGHNHLVVAVPLLILPTCYIFGGGHVGAAVCDIASSANFSVVVMDDRDDFASTARHPRAHGTVCCGPRGWGSAIDKLHVDGSYCVVVTHGHVADKDVVQQLLHYNPAYIGMIGSRRKKEGVYDLLRAGGASESDISRITSPIGLPIGGDTPGEIAVGIVAEMIQLKYKDVPKKK